MPPDFFSSPRTDFEAEWILLSFFIAAVVIKSPWAYDQKIAKTLKHAKEATSGLTHFKWIVPEEHALYLFFRSEENGAIRRDLLSFAKQHILNV